MARKGRSRWIAAVMSGFWPQGFGVLSMAITMQRSVMDWQQLGQNFAGLRGTLQDRWFSGIAPIASSLESFLILADPPRVYLKFDLRPLG